MGRLARIRVVIADDHALVRAGIVSLLRALQEVEVVGEADDGAQAVELCRSLAPDVAVLDISMKGVDGFEAAERITRDCPQTRVVILSMHREQAFIQRALAAGAKGYLIKDAATEELEHAVRAVVRGETYLSAALTKGVVDAYMRAGRSSDPQLTPRQREVLKLLAEGCATKEIAYRLGLSAKTVESHRAQIQARLGIRDLAGLIRYAMRTGLTPPEG